MVFEIGADINGAVSLGKKGGFVNYTVGLQHQQHTNRAGEPGEDVLFGVDGTNPWIQENPDLGMIVGQPDMNTGEIYLNAELPMQFMSKDIELYSSLGVTLRNGKSFALHRAPYWVF